MPQKIDHSKAQDALNAYTSHGGERPAAESLGISRSSMRDRLANAKRYGLKPQTQVLAAPAAGPPPGYKLKGTSTLYGEDGQQKLQWVKTDAALEQLYAAQRAAVEELKKELPPLKPIKAPKQTADDLLTMYTITDAHVGALAWDKETGADWDLSIAESCIVNTVTAMIDAAPASAECVINQLGDYLHFDSLKPLTPEHGHILDADSRYQKIVVVAVRILRRCIEYAMKKHQRVHLKMKEGNHDPSGSVWLRVLFAQLYENNKRVTIDMSPNPYTIQEHGKTMLGFYHGHLVKKVNLGELFAAQFREAWGRCEFVYIHTGHLHNHEEQERRGCKLIQHATIAAPDAYAARNGWISKRQMVSMTYSKGTGEVARGIFVPR